ncbi:hypothetical protein B0H14DRAFT_3113632 [Mycena olivaceomarginata]|nr:hypothetical protein B0H14DRAFT_3113632 [Mycena olivaceomarginata]
MPSQSTLNPDEKNKPNEWSYAGLQGALAFVRDTSKNTQSFQLVDLDGTRGVIWQFEVYKGLEYYPDRAFFHSFAADECMVGFVFADEREAKTLWEKVTKNLKKDLKSKPASEKKKKASKGKIDKSMISGPASGSFVHVAHMGYDEDQGFTSTGVDPSWTAFLGQLENSGIDKNVIAQDGVHQGLCPQAQRAAGPGRQGAQETEAASASITPHARCQRQHLLVYHTRPAAAASATKQSGSPRPIPPAPPRVPISSQAPPPARAPAAKPSSVPPPPPRPPAPHPPVPRRALVPRRAPPAPRPPPPPPPVRPAAMRRAPSSPSPASASPPRQRAPPPASAPAWRRSARRPPPAGARRNALLESIQGKGVHSLRKTEGPPARSAPEEPTSPAGAALT